MDAIEVGELSDLIGAVYDCALDRSRWQETLTRLRERLHFSNAIIGVNELPSGRLLVSELVGVASPWRELLQEHDSDIVAAWGGPTVAFTVPLDRPAVASVLNPNLSRQALHNRYISNWLQPQGLIDGLEIPLVRDATSIGTLAMGRHRDAGPIGPGEEYYAKLLLPHLQRAVAIGRLLEHQPVADDYANVLDALQAPIVIVAADLQIIFANRSAMALLESGTAITVSRAARGRELSASTARSTHGLHAAIRRACASDIMLADGSLAVPLPSGRDVYAAYVLALGRRPHRWLSGEAVAAVFITTPRAAPGASGEVAAALFGLTVAERRVFDAIAAGATVAEAALNAGIAASTVRTHLLHLFTKTGTRRQAELMQLATALAPPMATTAT